ncbi:MAG TPA: hypothetical protein VM165_07975 [Planctomycetaceae bacterium]|nr:hypothetical protein [Planctomycetaceae bacterium]
MFRSTLVPLFTVACLTLSTTTASAQNVLNPFTWFAPQPVYGYGYANCPNGQCGVQSGYRGMANCPNGNCNLPGACANGQCNVPMGGYGNAPYYNGAAPSYRNAPYGNSAPYYGNAPYSGPQYQPYNAPAQYQPYSAQRPVTRTPYYDRSVTPAGGFDWNTPTTARRNYSPSNSPFYP